MGVICYLILSDKFPFREKAKEKLYEAILAGKYSFPSTSWGSVSEDAKDFVEQLLTVDPQKRPTGRYTFAINEACRKVVDLIWFLLLIGL